MNDIEKRKLLNKYKTLATGLFVFMVLIFVGMTILEKRNPAHWIGYFRAFAEAAMVGALADWFAVTALFHYPLGIKIPHTNLIENSKERIGDNLGNFVVENFLSPQNIRPYIEKIKISTIAGAYLAKDHIQEVIINEGATILISIINKLEDDEVVHFIAKKAMEMTDEVKMNVLIGNGLEYILKKEDHQKMITHLSSQIKSYIIDNQNIVKNKVKEESYFLIPKFVDDGIAQKITNGLSHFFEEVENQKNHSLRSEITQKLFQFSEDIKTEKKWEEEFSSIKNDFLNKEKVQEYAKDIWLSIKKTVTKELEEEHSSLKKYIKKNLQELAQNLQTDEVFQNKIDVWVRATAYQYVLKNAHQFGALISSTVGNWKGQDLSEKLELEVGKDLQFIRVNGTLVGGLVGLLIYTITHFFI